MQQPKTQKTVLQGVALISRSIIDSRYRRFIRKICFTVKLTVYSLSLITDTSINPKLASRTP